MSKQRSKAPEITTEEVKNLLDKEQVCLLKAKEAIQQQLKVLQVRTSKDRVLGIHISSILHYCSTQSLNI